MNNGENIIFFDTETTGVIPRGKEEPLVYTNDFPHVVQLSWKLGDKEGDFIIKPDGFTIPDAAAAVHGITTDTVSRCFYGVFRRRESINGTLRTQRRSL